MFKREYTSVSDWWVLFILMAIPLVNIIVITNLLFSKTVNKNVKSYIIASVLPILIIFGYITVAYIN